jgi:hypothetical protein
MIIIMVRFSMHAGKLLWKKLEEAHSEVQTPGRRNSETPGQ